MRRDIISQIIEKTGKAIYTSSNMIRAVIPGRGGPSSYLDDTENDEPQNDPWQISNLCFQAAALLSWYHHLKLDKMTIIILITIAMLTIAIPTTGVTMAKEYIATQAEEMAKPPDQVSSAAASLTSPPYTVIKSDNTTDAPDVRGMTEAVAKKKLKDKYTVKVETEKMTYAQLIKKSSTLFFGEVDKQEQEQDEVTLFVAAADMDDALTAEMVSFGGRLAWPLPASHYITSRFGGRTSPGGIGSTNHKGLDIAASTGSAIIAVKDGEVTHAGSYGGYGNCVIIKHANGYETLYGHMSKVTCNVGDIVKPGDIIGRVGSTGISTGPHLHFGILKNGVYVDPEPYLTGTELVEAGEEVSQTEEDPESTAIDEPVKEEPSKDKKESGSNKARKVETKKPAKESTEATQPESQPTEAEPQPEPEKEETEPARQEEPEKSDPEKEETKCLMSSAM